MDDGKVLVVAKKAINALVKDFVTKKRELDAPAGFVNLQDAFITVKEFGLGILP